MLGYAVAIGVPLFVLLWVVFWPSKRSGPSVDDITDRIAREDRQPEPRRRGPRPRDGRQ